MRSAPTELAPLFVPERPGLAHGGDAVFAGQHHLATPDAEVARAELLDLRAPGAEPDESDAVLAALRALSGVSLADFAGHDGNLSSAYDIAPLHTRPLVRQTSREP